MSKEFWNERYSQNENVYGYAPNEFFKEQIQKVTPGKLFMPAEGEGRNALYAASLGWQVQACDYSEVARSKALTRAAQLGIDTLDYTIQDLSKLVLSPNEFDAIGLIYVHLPEDLRKQVHQQCTQSLKPGGLIIIEAFGKEQLQYSSGGPRESSLLYTIPELVNDFSSLNIILQEELYVNLKEGPFHSGKAHVVRLVARKK